MFVVPFLDDIQTAILSNDITTLTLENSVTILQYNGKTLLHLVASKKTYSLSNNHSQNVNDLATIKKILSINFEDFIFSLIIIFNKCKIIMFRYSFPST